MKDATKIAIALGAVLSLGVAAAVSAHPYGYEGGAYPMHGYGAGLAPGWDGHMGGPGYGMGWDGHMAGPGHHMGPQGMYGGSYGGVDDRLAELKEQLGITAQQNAAWQQFANSAKQQDESRQAWFTKMREAGSAASAPEALAQQTEFMKQRQAEMEVRATALKKLYATLTPEQQALADQRFGGFGPRWTDAARRGPRGPR